jgi:glycolate oxidase FAD binding subunit
VRDYVLGLELLNGRAELLRFGGTVMKNVAGYDVSRLMVGAMGTLGLITEVSLKVLPRAPAEATLRFQMDEATAIRQLNTWAGKPLPLNASSWVVDAGVPTLYLRLRGAQAAVDAACKLFATQHNGVRVDSPETSADWRAARDLTLPWFTDGMKAAREKAQDVWRISVPPTTPPLALGDTMIDWLGGQRWLFVDGGAASAQGQQVQKAARAAGGNASVFIAVHAHSIRANSQFDEEKRVPEAVEASFPAPLAAIQRRLKDEFDPERIFNPGRLIAGQ